jgi:excisionase family DNA binding protein
MQDPSLHQPALEIARDTTASDPPKQSALITVRDVMFETRLSRATIYEAIAAGELPKIKFGRATRFRRVDVEAWIARKLVQR